MPSRKTPPVRSCVAVIIVLVLCSWTVQAADLLIAPGFTNNGEATLNISARTPFKNRLYEGKSGHLSGYWTAGATWWEAARHGRDRYSISASPVFVWNFNAQGWQPFVEAGIGAAWFSSNLVSNRNLGSRLHFEDRFGVGMHLGARNTLVLRVIHYSNASLKKPNQGVNSWSLVWSHRF
ncbi:MAG TPA: acyloxyacyl hydrolase [Wenzhouxiangella sp.]|nr:acyloxyacyl hydrolase [Wenzhouxiangella sp.]